MRAVKTVVKFLLAAAALSAAVLLLAVLVLRASQRGGGSLFGYTAAVAVSGSMSGTFEVNDLVVTRAEDAYTVGDVITFREPGGALVTHRIVAEDPGGFVTQGDANNAADAWPVPAGAIVGRAVLVVPGVGRLVGFLQSPLGLSLLAAGALALLISLFWPRRRKEVDTA